MKYPSETQDTPNQIPRISDSGFSKTEKKTEKRPWVFTPKTCYVSYVTRVKTTCARTGKSPPWAENGFSKIFGKKILKNGKIARLSQVQKKN